MNTCLFFKIWFIQCSNFKCWHSRKFPFCSFMTLFFPIEWISVQFPYGGWWWWGEGGGCCLICFIPSSCYTILHILVLITDYSVYLIKMYIVRLKAAVTVNRGHLLFLSNWSHLRLVCPGASVCPTLNFEFFVRFMRLISVHYFHLFIHICNIKNINYTSTHA